MLGLILYVAITFCHYPGRVYEKHELPMFVQFALPDISHLERKAAVEIIWQESRGDSAARLGQHFGLFQQAEKVHGKASRLPMEQARWAYKYVTNRYGNFQRARAFQRARNYY